MSHGLGTKGLGSRRPARALALCLILSLLGVGPSEALPTQVGAQVSSQATGVLRLSVSGIPAGVKGRVSVTGPHGFRRMVGAIRRPAEA